MTSLGPGATGFQAVTHQVDQALHTSEDLEVEHCAECLPSLVGEQYFGLWLSHYLEIQGGAL